MKKISLTVLLIAFIFIPNLSIANTFNLIENASFQLIENEIIVTKLIRNRKVPLDIKNGNIKIYKGSKVNFKIKKTFSNIKNTYSWTYDEGNKQQGIDVNYQFDTIGEYEVKLSVLNESGEAIISKVIVIVKELQNTKDVRSIMPPVITINNTADPESGFSLQQLVEDVLVSGGCSRVDNFEVQVSGNPEDLDTKNYGYFKRGAATNFPFEDGIMITTGIASEAGNVYVAPDGFEDHPSFDNLMNGDADLEAALGIAESFDASFVKFNFTPAADTFSFRFLMASEEYDPEFECEFSDGFAFLLREVGTANYVNLAVLPDGTPVSVTNINNSPVCGNNQAFFEGYQLGETNYAGRTIVLTATSPVTPGVAYEMKLVVADAVDGVLDAAIFLEGGSFDLGGGLGDDVTIVNGNAGCSDVPVTIQTDQINESHTWYLNGVEIPGAGNGNVLTVTEAGVYSVDIVYGPDCIVNDSVIIEFIPIDDATFEMVPNCDGGTANILGLPGGVFSFDPIPTDGATIDPATGVVTGGVFGTNYTVKYETTGTCPSNANVSFTPTNIEDASFTMLPNCTGGTATITGNTGGVFSFNPAATDGTVIDAATGEISNGVSGTTYTVEYTTQGICPNSSTQMVTLLSEDDASFTTLPTCNGVTITVTGTPGGIFSFNPEPTDGAVIDATTGEISNGIPGTMYTIEYTTQGACSNSSTQMVTLLNQDDASFTTLPRCNGVTITVTGTPGGIFSFNPATTDGAVIDAATGEISNGIPGTMYTIEYTTQGTCSNSSIQMVTLLSEDDASFTTVPTCNGVTITVTGTPGGIFSFNPAPTDGAIIDTATGEIGNGTPGTAYTVEYTTQGVCPDVSNQTVTLLNQEDATFNMTPGCDSGIATVTGTPGGIFSFNPAPTDGAVIDTATGEITNGVPGTTYTIEYTTQGACPDVSIETITLLDQEDATFNMTPTCEGGTATITGVLGGIFSFNPMPADGAIIDANTGEVTNGVPGTTYNVEYTTQGACANNSIVSIETLPVNNALFTIMSTCDGGEATISGTQGGLFTFDPIPADGAIINIATGTVTNGTVGATYTIVYTVTNCFATHSENLTILPEPPLDMPEPLASCDETTPGEFAFFDLESKSMEILETTPYTTVTYHDTQVEAGNGTNPIASPYLSASRIVFVRAQDLTCFNTTTLELVVVPMPAIISHTYELCDDTVELDNDASNDTRSFNLTSQNPILLNGQDPGLHTVSYYLNQTDAESGINSLVSPYENTINPQTIYVRIENRDTLCFSTGEMILQVNPLPKIELEDEYVLCLDNDGTVILPSPIIDTGLNTVNYSFEWSLDGVLIVGETNGTISVTQPGNYSITATNNVTGCTANDETIVVESAPPLIEAEQVSITFVEDNTILATATNTSLNTALFEFKLDDGSWVSNVPNTNTYTFENVTAGPHIITARDLDGCGEASTTIIVLDFIPYFTPNGDSYHDTWNIIGLENQPDAKLYIFDRYGKLLKQLNPSGNGWDGTYNDNLMPSDDYWFTLQYKNPNTGSSDSFKSHFTLKR